jgi:hypothetical protein
MGTVAAVGEGFAGALASIAWNAMAWVGCILVGCTVLLVALCLIATRGQNEPLTPADAEVGDDTIAMLKGTDHA